jgi:hypothetical protein
LFDIVVDSIVGCVVVLLCHGALYSYDDGARWYLPVPSPLSDYFLWALRKRRIFKKFYMNNDSLQKALLEFDTSEIVKLKTKTSI